MINQYLRAFVIGSSCLVFLPYFYVVSHFTKEKFNFDYMTYTFLAPPSLGLMNMISLFMEFSYSTVSNVLGTSVSSVLGFAPP